MTTTIVINDKTRTTIARSAGRTGHRWTRHGSRNGRRTRHGRRNGGTHRRCRGSRNWLTHRGGYRPRQSCCTFLKAQRSERVRRREQRSSKPSRSLVQSQSQQFRPPSKSTKQNLPMACILGRALSQLRKRNCRCIQENLHHKSSSRGM